jgi:hypothetical protein
MRLPLPRLPKIRLIVDNVSPTRPVEVPVITDDGTFVFLSPEWIDAAEEIYERHRHHTEGAGLPALVVNLAVDGAPFGDGKVAAHTDTTSGDLVIRRGHAASPDLTIRLGYDTARSLMVDQDPQLALEALIFGRILIEGDLLALSDKIDMNLAEMPALLESLNLGGIANLAEIDPVAAEVADELRAITAA